MEFKKRERLLILAALFCIVIFTGDQLIFTPMGRIWKKRSEQISLLQKSVEKGDILLDRKEDIKERWEKMKESGLPDDPSAAENRILNRVHEWAIQSGLNLSSLKPRWVETGEEEKTLEFRLSGTGNLETVSRFLFELERDALPLSLEDFTISVRDKKNRTLDFSARFSGLILKETKI